MTVPWPQAGARLWQAAGHGEHLEAGRQGVQTHLAKVSRNAEQPGGTCRRPPHPNRAPGTSPPMISDPSPRARAARQRRAAHRPVSPTRGREGPRGSRTCSSSFPGQRGLLPAKSAPWGLLPPKSAPCCPSPTTWQEILPPGSGIWLDLPACPGPVPSLSGSQFPHLQIKQIIPRVSFSYKILNLKRKKMSQKEAGASATSLPLLVTRGTVSPGFLPALQGRGGGRLPPRSELGV